MSITTNPSTTSVCGFDIYLPLFIPHAVLIFMESEAFTTNTEYFKGLKYAAGSTIMVSNPSDVDLFTLILGLDTYGLISTYV